jgi:hypothetical protein
MQPKFVHLRNLLGCLHTHYLLCVRTHVQCVDRTMSWFPTRHECMHCKKGAMHEQQQGGDARSAPSTIMPAHDVCGAPKMSVDLRRCLWSSEDVCGSPKMSVELRRCLWSSEDVCGAPKMSVELRRCLWSSDPHCLGCMLSSAIMTIIERLPWLLYSRHMYHEACSHRGQGARLLRADSFA